MSVEILQTHKLLASCEEALAARYTVHKLHQAADREALLADLRDRVRGIAGGNVGPELMDKLPKLEIIANFGVGYDTIDTAAAKARSIRVTNTPDVLNDAMAEITIGLMIALARKLPQADHYVRQGKWKRATFPLQAELNGKTLGILGLGRIGKEIALRAQAMKMRVVYHGRHRQPDEPFVYYDKLIEMARDVDWLLAIAPGGKATEKVISRQVLEALGPTGYLVSMGRGTSIDQAALLEMLQAKTLGGAAMDVFENEPDIDPALFALDNVVLSPHQGSATHQTRNKMGALVVANLDAHFAGDPLPSAVV